MHLTFAEFRIVIICSSESEETSHVVSKLLQFKRDYAIFQADKELAEYLKHHFRNSDATSAANIDPEKLVFICNLYLYAISD